MADEPNENLAETTALPAENAAGESQAIRVVEVLDEYLASLKEGEKPDRTALLAKHPELASQLEACLAGLDFIHASSDRGSTPKRLGDFEIIREVGRGGMGAVYEARQISLGRHVALKILRFGGVSDLDAVNRFQREAETVASLHHTNIVPIFAVGNHEGVNYYAMQFIEGQSLDQILKDSQQRTQSISADTVAQWGLQAAEALAHAHARGVIHRDVKPSNLILDNEGRIWLTDFGLAKRLDDVTLSMTGALLGTPRYMSPEQASAAHNQVDHRTDVYSLGATLYELATGKPVFSGTSPHDVIRQIITAEPSSARLICQNLPRDLDTILMKCLSKDASRRYDSARKLADDLRAFAEGRPISARRASFVERSARWLKRQKSTVGLAVSVVAATVAMILLGVTTTYAWHRSRLTAVLLRTDHPPLVVEMKQAGKLAAPPLTVPNQTPLEISAGEYQVHVAADQRLSETFDVQLKPQTPLEQKLDLEDQMLWTDMKIDRTFQLAHFRGLGFQPAEQSKNRSVTAGQPIMHAEVITMDDSGIRRRNHPDAVGQWELKLAEPSEELLKNQRIIWPWNHAPGRSYDRGLGRFDARPWVVTSDTENSPLLLAARHQAWIIAVEAETGKPLWFARRGGAMQEVPNAHYHEPAGAILYQPEFVPDHNNDGVADVLASWIDRFDRNQPTRRVVELLSGANGETIWQYDIPAAYFDLPAGEEVPVDLSWFYSASGGYSSGGSGDFIHGDSLTFHTRRSGLLQRTGDHAYLPTSPHWAGSTDRSVKLVAGKQFIDLDSLTGKPKADPQPLASRPGLEPSFVHLDDDGHVDVLLVEQLPDKQLTPASLPTFQQIVQPQTRLVAWSSNKQAILWERIVEASWPHQDNLMLPVSDWPHVSDIDANGIADVLVPDGSTEKVHNWSSPPWGKLTLIDGATGHSRWTRQLFNLDEQLDCSIIGPDINDDGHREVFVAAFWRDSHELFVDCLSGTNGETLWRADETFVKQRENDFRLGNLQWVDGLGDGWPQLVVTIGGDEGRDGDRVYFLSAGTGQITHQASEVSQVEAADFNGDGVSDLALFHQADSRNWDRGGTLQAVRGTGRDAWRRLNEVQRIVGDLDGDGIRDSVQTSTQGQLLARSSATGTVIWETDVDLSRQTYQVSAPTTFDPQHDALSTVHDLDGDAVPDILLVGQDGYFRAKKSGLVAVSGRTGRLLWKSDFAVQKQNDCQLLDCRDLDGDGAVEIIFATDADYGLPAVNLFAGSGYNPTRLWLSVIEGKTGKVRWAKPITQAPAKNGAQPLFDLDRNWLEAAYADLNSDGVLDIVFPRQAELDSQQVALAAISGSDGAELWKFPLNIENGNMQRALGDALPATLEDLDGDDRLEVIALDLTHSLTVPGSGQVVRLSVLDGASGKTRWNWETPASHWHHEVKSDPNRAKNRLRVVTLPRSDGTQWIALLPVVSDYEQKLHILDASGRPLGEKVVKQHLIQNPGRLWVLDNKLVLQTQSSASLLVPNRLEEPVWTRPDVSEIVGILPDSELPARILIRSGFSIRGLDIQSGDPRWIVAGPHPQSIGIQGDSFQLLNAPSTVAPPHVMYQYRNQVRVRRGIDFADQAKDWTLFGRPAASLRPDQYDRRLLRPLPWLPQGIEAPEFLRMLMWSALWGVLLIIIPSGYLAWMFGRRQFGIKTLLWLPIIAGTMMLAIKLQPSGVTHYDVSNKFGIALATVPVFVAIALFVKWIRHRRLRPVLFWGAAVILIGAIAMGVNLFMVDLNRGGGLQPGERYDWSGWYWMYPGVTYVMCWATLAWIIVAWCAKGVWCRVRGAVKPQLVMDAAKDN
ncbi:protein kinase [Novipirellula sp.]|uniref:protein kinase domain-containing protein n=1 Tax=Novipirellula sp. TaxID=2795430 RepID=UPI00356285EA